MTGIEEYRQSMAKIDEFCSIMARKGRKANSISVFRSMTTSMIRFLNDHEMHVTPEQIGEDEIREIIDYYQIGPATMKGYIESLGKWMVHYGNYTVKEMDLLWNAEERVNIRWIDEAEFRTLLRCARNPTEAMILLLGAKCGLRRHEMTSLKISDIRGNVMTVYGKGHGAGKIRQIPLSDEMMRRIHDYMDWRGRSMEGKESTAGDRLLIRPYKSKVTGIRDDWINITLRDLSIATGIDFTPHSLRRLFATTAASCTSIYNVQTLMGHSSIAMTERYIKRKQSELESAMEAISATI